jgi:hypothetical protein
MRTLTLSAPYPARRLWVGLAMTLAVVLAPSASRADVVALVDDPVAILDGGGESPKWEFAAVAAPPASDVLTSPLRGPGIDGPLPAAPRYPGAGTARVDVKCWQEGVLIVHETRLVAATEPFSYMVKFPSALTGGVPTYIADARNATCLIKPAAADAETTPRRR